MSNSALKLLAASGAKGSATYVDDLFSTFLYEGTGVNQVIDNGIALADEGGLVWFKNRSGGDNNCLYDTERGAGKVIFSDSTGVQLSATGAQQVTFRSAGNTGFETGTGYGGSENGNGDDICSWTFRKQEKFFDIVTYTGNATNGREIAHNLGSVPGLIIIKELGTTNYWPVYHRSLGGTKNLYLDNTTAATTWDGSWNNTAPTSTVFTVGGQNENNRNGGSHVAYLFAHDEQEFGTGSDEAIIKCGSFTTDSNAVFYESLGFEPQWVLIKRSSGSGSWNLLDNMRGFLAEGTAGGKYLRPDSANAEGTLSSADSEYVNSTGFGGNGNGVTGSANSTFVYVAIRRPHKPAEEFAATDLFKQDNDTTTTSPKYVSGFPVDFALQNTVDETGYTQLSSRLTGKQMYTPVTDVEEGSPDYDYSTGFKEGGGSTNADDYGWMWRRAPGFTDVVCYKGTGSSTWFNHNLGVVPEMVWFKGRNIAEHWNVFTTGGGTTGRLQLNDSNEYNTTNQNQFWTNLPTATQFRLSNSNEINGSGYNYIAYLFASADGISKLGTYAGTGSAQNIDCGFSAGARFVLIKRVNQAGFWMVWDSARGIVAGNDPFLALNRTAAHITNTDYIDPLASGFTITSSAPTDNSDYTMNKSGSTYFFYAIA